MCGVGLKLEDTPLHLGVDEQQFRDDVLTCSNRPVEPLEKSLVLAVYPQDAGRAIIVHAG
jgi:hypothetical protein